jgi:hypothetical protein
VSALFNGRWAFRASSAGEANPPLGIENDRRKNRRILPGAEVDVHCVNELKGRSSEYLFAINSGGYVSLGSDLAAASG